MRQTAKTSAEWIRFFVNLLTAGVVLWVWVTVIQTVPVGASSAAGWSAMKYYTVLSNLLAASVCLLWCVSFVRPRLRLAAERLKFVAAATIWITFFVVVTFLGPLYGYASMFTGANFWLHLAVPLTIVTEFILCSRAQLSVRHTLWAVLPVTVYGAVYLSNIAINGIGDPPTVNDFYGFATWGLPAGVLLFALLLGMAWLFAQLLRIANRCAGGGKEQ